MLIIGTWLATVVVGLILGHLTHSLIGLYAPIAPFLLFWGWRALMEWKQINKGE